MILSHAEESYSDRLSFTFQEGMYSTTAMRGSIALLIIARIRYRVPKSFPHGENFVAKVTVEFCNRRMGREIFISSSFYTICHLCSQGRVSQNVLLEESFAENPHVM